MKNTEVEVDNMNTMYCTINQEQADCRNVHTIVAKRSLKLVLGSNNIWEWHSHDLLMRGLVTKDLGGSDVTP